MRLCEDCDGEIEASRLVNKPYARWCIEHAKAHDDVEKVRVKHEAMHGLGRAADKPELPRGYPGSRKRKKR